MPIPVPPPRLPRQPLPWLRRAWVRLAELADAADDVEMAASVQTGCAARRDGSRPKR